MPGKDYVDDIAKLYQEMEHLRRIVGDTPLIGTVVCPECAKSWDLHDNLHIGAVSRAVFVCDCRTELVVTSRGVQRKRG